MARASAFPSIAMTFCLATGGCRDILGGIDVSRAPETTEQTSGSLEGDPGPDEAPTVGGPLFPGGPIIVPGGGPTPGEVLPRPDAGVAPSLDAGTGNAPPDAGPPPLVARPIVTDGPASQLPLVGFEGGGPRLGSCREGLVIGIRSTANPSEEVFGQRITFIEPICAQAFNTPARSVTLLRNESILAWDETGDFLGVPPTEVPDPRLIWVPQPDTLCPESAPVLVGLSGEYDPIAPDSVDTAAIRSFVIECAPLVVAPNGIDVSAADSGHQLISQADGFAAIGTDVYTAACEGGGVMTTILVHSGFWLDGFVLGCSNLRSPRLAGEPCSEARECQSDVCSPEGACAP